MSITREMLEAAGCRIVEYPPIPEFAINWAAYDITNKSIAHNIGHGWKINAGCRPRFRLKAKTERSEDASTP